MNKEELRKRICELTPEEIRKKQRLTCACSDGAAGSLPKETFVIEAEQFMSPLDKLIVYKQDRYELVGAHKHDYIELCYVWSGKSIQEIEGKRLTIRQGDVCIFDTQAVHSVDVCGEKDILINILMKKEFFDTAFLSRMTKQGIVSNFLVEAVTKSRQRKHYLYFQSHKNPRICEIMENILLEQYNQDLGMNEVLESYVIILFTELLRTWRDDSKERDSFSNNVQVLELLAYIEENYENCTLQEMGKKFGMHGNYLTALLKEKTGHSFVEHIQEQKLKKARTLLKNTDISITELIPLCGYNNMNFFYKKFKEAEGCTPAEYRKRYRDQPNLKNSQ